MLKFICITVFVQKLEIFLTSLRFLKILIKFICTKTIQTRGSRREQLIMARNIFSRLLYLKLFQNLLLHDNEAKEVKTINHILSNVRN